MKASKDFQVLATLFGVLSDTTRLRIIASLKRDGKVNVSDLCDEIKAPQPTISHHLSILRMSGVVDCTRKGKQMFYSLAPGGVPSVVMSTIGLSVREIRGAKKAASPTPAGDAPQAQA